MFVQTVIVFGVCICFALGHNMNSNSENQMPLRKSRSVFEDCCLGRKLLCKNPGLPWERNMQSRPKLLLSSQVCDGISDCPLGEDEVCIKCGNPPDIPSGHRVDDRSFFPIGTVVNYACQSGFVFRDDQSVYCDVRGSWSKAPVCVRLCLSAPPAIPNAKASAVISPYIVGTVVPYTCDVGYAPDRSSRMIYTCDANGNWIGGVTCSPATSTGNVIICDTTTFSISCPAPTKIEVQSAIFGRTSADINCNGVPKAENCSISVVSILSGDCNGKSTCRLEVSGFNYPQTTCPPATDKYLEMQFICK